jgi:MinD superfamily P-loop ATPase
MKKITVISGKGGTGKTVITASFASLAPGSIAVDCDVDAADLHLILEPRIREKHVFKSGSTACIEEEKCTCCGMCRELCRFHAIGEDFTVDPVYCEGCGLCSRICPAEAVEMRENITGEWYLSDTFFGPLFHARLGIAQENSGKLVTTIKSAASEMGNGGAYDFMIVDGPPGIGCPVYASLTGSDRALVVAEPTLSGLHDMQRVLDVVDHFGIEAFVTVNKYDLHRENTEEILSICQKRGIQSAGLIPFSQEINESIVNRVPAVDYCSSEIADSIRAVWLAVSRS